MNGRKLQVSCPVKNTGNVLVRPAGLIEIKSGDKTLGTMNFMEGKPVYPGLSRAYSAASIFVLKPGEYKVVINISCAGQTKVKEKQIKIGESGEIIIQ